MTAAIYPPCMRGVTVSRLYRVCPRHFWYHSTLGERCSCLNQGLNSSTVQEYAYLYHLPRPVRHSHCLKAPGTNPLMPPHFGKQPITLEWLYQGFFLSPLPP